MIHVSKIIVIYPIFNIPHLSVVKICYNGVSDLSARVLGDGGGGHWLVRMEWHPAGWSVYLPLLIFPCTIKSRSFSSGTVSPRWFRKKGRKMVVMVVVLCLYSINCE